MSKPLIVVLADYDWAGSGYFASEAINTTNRANCYHIAMHRHPWGFPSGIVAEGRGGLNTAREMVRAADLVHFWNFMPHLPIFDPLKIGKKKIRSATMTGSLYRNNWKDLNKYFKENKIKLTVQNPSYRHPEDYPSTFIPHALPPSATRSNHWTRREPGTIGCYDKPSRSTTTQTDLSVMESVLSHFPKWILTMRGDPIPWPRRIADLRQCQVYFEYLDQNMQYWGRSAIEACAMGIPPITFWSDNAMELAGDRLGTVPMIRATVETLHSVLNQYLNDDETLRAVAEDCRRWAIGTFSYMRVGNDYMNFFDKVL